MRAIDLKQFKRDRNRALLSLNRDTITAYFKKYNVLREIPEDEEIFWRAVHKARTGCTELPMAARSESKRWLIAHGSQPWDNGEVPV